MQTKDQHLAKRGPRRKANEGNRLWELYREASASNAERFRAMLLEAGIPFATFQKQSQRARTLGTVPTRNFQLYRNFFLGTGAGDLLEDFWAEQSATTKAAA